jgi:hypothetical protein
MAQHPAIELRHHQIMLEHRQEVARRQQRALFLAHAHQHFAHRKFVLPSGKRRDGLAVKREFVLLERFAQPRERLRPADEVGAGAFDRVLFHGLF